MQASPRTTTVLDASARPAPREVNDAAEWCVERELDGGGIVLTLACDGDGDGGQSFALAREDAGDLACVLERFTETASERVAHHTRRREAAEQALAGARTDSRRLEEELEHLRRHLSALHGELAVAESCMRELAQACGAAVPSLRAQLGGRRVLYVGGRPSATPSIRGLVLRNGGIFQQHDAVASDDDDRLSHAVAHAAFVVMPQDCTDPDTSAWVRLLCNRHGVTFVPVRAATIASFCAGMSCARQPQGARAASAPRDLVARPVQPY